MINRLLNKLSPFRSVRARFSAVIGASGIALGLVLTLFMEWHIESALRETARDALGAMADQIAHEIVEDLSNRQREVALIADLVGHEGIVSPQSVQEVIDGLQQRQSAYAWIGMVGLDGGVQAASGGLLKNVDVSSRPWFAGGVQGDFIADPHDALLLANYLQPRPNGEPPRFLDVATPIKNGEGAVIGVLAAHLYWDWVHDVVAESLRGHRKNTPLQVLIANRQGDWLLQLPSGTDTGKDSGIDHRIDQVQAMQADDRYVAVTRKVWSAVPQSGLGWTVMVREDAQFAFAPIDEVRRLMLSVTVLLAAVFAWVSWVIAGRVVQPIVALADEAKNHAGEWTAFASPAGLRVRDETGVLGQAMDRLAHHDRLTGLYNRAEMLARLHQAISRAAGQRAYGALLLVNLDNVTLLNNTRGHDAGDQLLIASAKRLLSVASASAGAVVARLGGDEFLVLLEGLGSDRAEVLGQAVACAQRIQAQLRTPFVLDTGTYQGQASTGVALLGDELITADDVLKRTELAMLEAKKRGKDQLVVFDQRMQDELYARVQFETDLRAAIPSQLVVLYQPQVDLHQGLTGAEVLVRWQHPSHGLVSPLRFIPLAEQTGLILPLGQWVLTQACQQLRQWAAHPVGSSLVLSVNVSVKEFTDPGYVQGVLRILSQTHADPHRLKLELTESVLAHDVDAVVHKMQELRSTGIRFSLDDFGTGFSSLSYLRRLPLDQLKIDQSFVRDVCSHTSAASIVRAVVALGQGLGLPVIAEGVETQEQQRLLHSYGCDRYQGYLYGRPVPVDELEADMGKIWRR